MFIDKLKRLASILGKTKQAVLNIVLVISIITIYQYINLKN